mgnify:FL=1
MEGIRGMQRFLQRVWRNFIDLDGNLTISGQVTPDQTKMMHQTILRVTDHIENLRFNTAIAAMIEWNNGLVGCDSIPEEIAQTFLLLLNPLAPHISEELWERGNWGRGNLAHQTWPKADKALAAEDTVTLPIQVNGKMRGQIEVDKHIEEEELKKIVLEMENVSKFIPSEETIKRFIVVPGRIVNIVVSK